MLSEDRKKEILKVLDSIIKEKQFFYISEVLEIVGEPNKKYGITSDERKFLNKYITTKLTQGILGVSDMRQSGKQYYIIDVKISILDYL